MTGIIVGPLTKTWVQTLPSLPATSKTLTKLLSFSRSQFLHLQNEETGLDQLYSKCGPRTPRGCPSPFQGV